MQKFTDLLASGCSNMVDMMFAYAGQNSKELQGGTTQAMQQELLKSLVVYISSLQRVDVRSIADVVVGGPVIARMMIAYSVRVLFYECAKRLANMKGEQLHNATTESGTQDLINVVIDELSDHIDDGVDKHHGLN